MTQAKTSKGKAAEATSLEVELPALAAEEIARVAEATQRSTAFIALRALLAAPQAQATAGGATRRLALTCDEDDPANTLTKIKGAAGKRSLDVALGAAWGATRARFAKFLQNADAVRAAESADELDEGLAQAADPRTPGHRLSELATSAYPRIRALVAAHPQTPAEALAKLARDKEPYVRDATENRKLAGR